MTHNFTNWIPAAIVMENCSSPAARGALELLHSGMANCAGIPGKPDRETRFVRLPAAQVNLEWLYRSVAEIVSTWEDEKTMPEEADPEMQERIWDDPLLPPLSNSDKTTLLQFAARLNSSADKEKNDIPYCIWLFAESILRRGLWSKVMDGTIARIRKQQENQDFESWAASWD